MRPLIKSPTTWVWVLPSLALLCFLLGLASAAPVRAQKLPSYATAEETIAGRIRSIDGQYHITLRDNKGYLDSVALHASTLINPAGVTLEPRMNVTIFGYASGSVFVANEIDAQDQGAQPTASTNHWATQSYPSYSSGPSYNVTMAVGYPAYSSYGYGWPYWGSPFYSPFSYGYVGYPRSFAYYPYRYGYPYWGYSTYRPYYPYRWGGGMMPGRRW